jgi:hypothetical protein
MNDPSSMAGAEETQDRPIGLILSSLTRAPRSLMVFFMTAIVYVCTGVYGGVQLNDTRAAAIAAWELGVHHTVNIRSGVASLGGNLWFVQGAHGYVVTNRFPGAILMAAPMYALFGGSSYSPMPGTIAAALAAAATCALLYRLLLRQCRPSQALVGVALFAFATAQWTVSGRELWEHSGAELLIVAGMLAMSSRRWAWAGLAFGFTMMFRAHLGIGVAVICLGILWMDRWGPALTFAIAALPGLVGYLAWNWLLFGHFTVTGGYSDVTPGGVGILGLLDNIAGTLVSPERGLLVCSPILLVAVIGLGQAWRQSSRLVRVWTFGGLAYLASQLWLIRYSGGDGFIGYRASLETLVWCSPLLFEAGILGGRRLGATWVWLLSMASVAFFSAGAFDLADTFGTANPWTTWTPIRLAQEYGLSRLLMGAGIGAGAVFVAWALVQRRSARRPQVESAVSLPAAAVPVGGRHRVVASSA